MLTTRRLMLVLAVLAVLGLWLALLTRPTADTAGSQVAAPSPTAAVPAPSTPALPPAAAAADPASPEPPAPAASPEPAQPLALTGTAEKFAVPPLGTRAKSRPWVKASIGSGEGQLGYGYLGGSTETYSPQGFVVTTDGKLLVLDSNNRRLSQYDAQGRIERTIKTDPLVMPADVAVARDGTIIVVDHSGLHTKGLLLLRPDGTKLRELPAIQDDLMMGMYAVGDDFYFDLGSDGSVRGGNISGDLSDETPGVYNNEDGEIVPGSVAPDGTTVIDLGAEDGGLERGEFFVSAVRGEAPEHVFTHKFIWPHPLASLGYVQADERGQIYAVLLEPLVQEERPVQHYVLLCLDPRGKPVGLVDMGSSDATRATELRRFTVAPSGGLVFQRLAKDSISYDWYDCH